MIVSSPHLVSFNGAEYALGTVRGQEIHYSFGRIVAFLELKGKATFGSDFRIFTEDHEILKKLIYYQIRDEENCKRHQLDPSKGILLTGPIGCGKTSLMKLLSTIVPHRKAYQVIPSRNIVFEFNKRGHEVISDYGSASFFCFDDVGVEPMGQHFGQECNVLGEVLLSRYDYYVAHGVRTHITTNLNARELESRYGNRVRSRMRRLFNLISFDTNSKDKR